jgi:hypothetical protein
MVVHYFEVFLDIGVKHVIQSSWSGLPEFHILLQSFLSSVLALAYVVDPYLG